jgi:hypothetical protein
MVGTLIQQSVLVNRALPTAYADGSTPAVPPRVTRYVENYVQNVVPTKHALVDQGSYFVSGMLNGATSLQLGIYASYTSITSAIVFNNIDSPSNPLAKRCFLDYIRFIIATAGTSGTNLLYQSTLDIGRVPTVSALGTPTTGTGYAAPANNTNMDLSTKAVGQPYFPQSTAAGVPMAVSAATANARTIVGNGALRNTICVVNDEFRIAFGGVDWPYVVIPPATITKAIEPHPPVCIGPGQSYIFSLFSGSNVTAGNALSNLEMGWWEV